MAELKFRSATSFILGSTTIRLCLPAAAGRFVSFGHFAIMITSFGGESSMKLAIYSTKQYDRKYLELVNKEFGFELEFFDFLLSAKTAKSHRAVRLFAFCERRCEPRSAHRAGRSGR